ncbi:putative membrane protein [Collimonas arenae]|uniref:Putative membrane protein n=1 Tax=Collimonas arenae TaxID=279058 RepID=A0A127PK69_9BURK|nr:hypothetical protein [Collimonas arenae]AMO98115.1 putative membrane protein [Collimonas arenae]AMP07982.1 putative membrane protein [Collimonas arenae]
MKDHFQLLTGGALFAIIAWAFWHFLGNDAFSALSTIALLVLFVDNVRLRRKLKPEQRD